ncbi:hypothetical protein CBS101457_003661 [Exobasidium rhododendri]|nr:hypothetical protein CBS101457_003661 [Exobasidium rhododendri]
MSSTVASAQPSAKKNDAAPANVTGNGGVQSQSSNGQIAMSSSTVSPASGAPAQPSTTSIPPHMQQILMSMNKEKLQQMVVRMKTLQANGETEQSSQEYANLVNTFRYFQQVQSMRQQQARLQHQAGQTNGSSADSSKAAEASTPSTSIAEGGGVTVMSSSTDSSQSVSSALPSSAGMEGAATSTVPTSTFSTAQLAALKTQIIAFKMLARNVALPAQLKAALLDPNSVIDEIKEQMEVQVEDLGLAGKVAEAGVESHLAAEKVKKSSSSSSSIKDKEASKTAGQQVQRAASPQDDPSSSVYPYNAFRHPFTYLSKPSLGPEDFTATKQKRLLVPSLMPAGIDPHLLLQERDRYINVRIQQRIRELEGLPSTMSQKPTLSSALKGKDVVKAYDPAEQSVTNYDTTDNAKIKALIELKSLHLLSKQKALRESITRQMGQATTLALDRTAFRRFKKQTLRDARMTEQLERKQRVDREKRARQNHIDYLNSICSHGRDLMAAHKHHQANSVQRMGKLVLRLHNETEREEQKRIERIAKERLNALKADDEEAYLKLIDTAKDTRITHLIRQTDAYLEGLAQAVQAQQNDDVHAEAIAAERAGIAPPSVDELAKQAANQEVGLAVDETMFGAQRQDDPNEDKGKVDYYSVAHRITERITEQPKILIGGTLKDYQIKGLQWMVSLYNNRLNGILADEMGLGKTIQTIALITFLIETKKQRGPYLVIVPLSTLTNWVNEFEKWAPAVNTVVYKGQPQTRKNLTPIIRSGNYDCLLTTYEYIIKDKHLLGKIRWTHMIIDEGHRMKNTQSKLTLTLTSFYVSRYRLLLTGTPLQNNLPELWALLNFVLPKIFNSVKSFDEWFNTPFANTGANDGSMQLNEEEALLIIKRLHKVLRPFLLRRLKKDVESELPDKVERVIKCKMSSLQKKLYQQMKNHKVLLAGEDLGPGRKGKPQGIRGLQNAIMQLRKICNHPYVFEQVEMAINPTKETGLDLYRVSGKFELLDRLLPKLKATRHRVLIFFQMTAIMDIMEDFLRFRGFKYLRLDGSTKPEDRTLLLNAFNAPGSDIDIFILSTRAGGLGLNLQTADTVIIYDSDWNPHQDLQAQDRAHRIGQKMEVRILRLVTTKSVEETILERARDKLEIDGKVIQAGKFDNQATAAEREDLLRAMLEADNEEEEEEEDADLDDDELNELLSRGDTEVATFKKMDEERVIRDMEEWRAIGFTGTKLPDRLIQEEELPSLYQQDFDTVAVLEEAPEEEVGVRRRAVVHYDDGLTEEQFLRALEDDDVDIADVVEKKRERAEKRRIKVLQSEVSATTSEAGSPEPLVRKKSSKASKGKTSSSRVTQTPEPSPGGPAKKRKRPSNFIESPSPDDDDSIPGSKVGGGGGGTQNKKRKSGGSGGAGDDVRDQIYSVLLACYKAVENSTEQYEDGSVRKRTVLFMDVPKKSEYPDYHVIIQRPICLRQIKRKIDNRTYPSVVSCLEDFELMINNAKTYNQEGSWVYNDAVELMSVFQEKYDALAKRSGLPGSENEGGSMNRKKGHDGDEEDIDDDDGDDEEEEEEEEEKEEDSKNNIAATVAPPTGSRPKIRLSMKLKGGGGKNANSKRASNETSDAAMDDDD